MHACTKTSYCVLVPSLGCCAFDSINNDFIKQYEDLRARADRPDCSLVGLCADAFYEMRPLCDSGRCDKISTGKKRE